MMSQPTGAPAAPKPSQEGPDWSRLVGDSLKSYGPWHTYTKLVEARKTYPNDLRLRGYFEIVRNAIVRDFLAHEKGFQAVPKLSAEFLTNFDQFNLNAQEGYLISLIDGRMNIQHLQKLSPFDPFTTLFNLAKLAHQKAISMP